MSTVSPNQTKDLAWLLKGPAEQIPGIRGSVLQSSDGITKAAYGLDRVDAEYLAALASGTGTRPPAAGPGNEGR